MKYSNNFFVLVQVMFNCPNIYNKMKPTKLLALALFFFSQLNCIKLKAQCPASVTASILSKVNPTCPSNGSVTIGSNANGIATSNYQITAAPPGITLSSQSSNLFTSLLPGNYTFKVTCGSSFATVNTTLTTTYVQLTANTTVSNTCVNFTRGGTITVTAANGNAPYTYSVLKTTNANYTDNLSVYGSNNVFNTTDSGAFQIRVKDACGNFITKTVIIEPSSPGFKLSPYYVLFNQACASGNVSLEFDILDLYNVSHWIGNIDGGLKFDVYKKGTGCVRGAFISSQTLPQSSSTQQLVIPENQSVYIRVTNICGDTMVTCYNYPTTPLIFSTYWYPTMSGCATVTAPNGYLNIIFDYSAYGKGPISYALKTLSGTTIRPATFDSTSFNSLIYGTYVVIGTDACGKIAKDTIYPPALGSNVDFSGWTGLECITQTGTFSYSAFINGYVQDLQHAIVTITSGPSNVGTVGNFVGNLPVIQFQNMVSGTYTASIISACANKTVTFTIDATEPVLIQSLNVTTQQACNNGGVIYANLNYNGQGVTFYNLYNNSNVLLATNSSGNFTSLSAGTYVVKAQIEFGSQCGNYFYTINKTIIIYPDGAPPQVIKKVGLICEDINGLPTTTGKAIIKQAGAGPFKIEIKKTVEPDANYVLKTTNSINSFTINGLLPYENYRVRITDACGNTALTDIAIGQLQQLTATNSQAPCVGIEYILSAPDFINATYSWKLNGVIISTDRELIFPSYSNANNGSYECTIAIGDGCVTRTFTSILTGTCGVLPVKLESLIASAKDCNVQVKWLVSQEINASRYEVERSNSGNKFEKIGEVFASNNVGSANYALEDKTPLIGTSFYRIKMIDKNGTYNYSSIVTVKNVCMASEKSILLYPNPTFDKTVNFAINSAYGGSVIVNFFSITGLIVRKEKMILNIGDNLKTFKLNEFTKGIYLLRITDNNGNEVATQKLLVE